MKTDRKQVRNWFGTTKGLAEYICDMPRPHINESTIEAAQLLANTITEFDVSKFDMDTQIRMALWAACSAESDTDYNLETEVQNKVKPFDT